MIPEPYTYYRNNRERRAWLILDVRPDGTFEPPQIVVMLEWGKSRRQPTYLAINNFQALVASGKLELFTPKI
ncbi:MAG: hypothetical protein JST36_07600 [Bacteroidetes bacterium]|nr:hypothetical protein [Bacteroidota bacterium]